MAICRSIAVFAAFIIGCSSIGPETEDEPNSLGVIGVAPGGSLTSADTVGLSWERPIGATSNLLILFSTDSGRTWSDTLSAAIEGQSAMVVLPAIVSDYPDCLFRVVSGSESLTSARYTLLALSAVSDTLEVKGFQDGFKLLSEDTIELRWEKAIGNDAKVKVLFSKDSGATWKDTVEISRLNSAVIAVVPYLLTETYNCRFKLVTGSDSLLSPIFAIKNLIITRPRSASMFQRGDTVHIEWVAHRSISSVAAYLTRPGKPEIMLMEEASVTTSMPQWPRHSWIIPDTLVCTDCNIRIEDYLDPATTDQLTTGISIQ